MSQNENEETKVNLRKATVLILGTAESGKSTLCRHMRQLYGNQFDDNELLQFKSEIQSSCLQYFKTILVDLLKEERTCGAHKDRCENFIEEYEKIGPAYHKFCPEMVMSIWSILSVQQFIFEKTNKSNLRHLVKKEEKLEKSTLNVLQNMYSDNPAIHFLTSFDRIMLKEYVPSLEDILNLRSPTKGKINFRTDNNELLIKHILYGELNLKTNYYINFRSCPYGFQKRRLANPTH